MEELIKVIKDQELILGVLSSPFKKEGIPEKVTIRPLKIKTGFCYQFTEQMGNQAFHKNVTPKECATYIADVLGKNYKQGIFSTPEIDFHLLANSKGEIKVIKKKRAISPSLVVLEHNRKKDYLLKEGQAISFLVELGIMSKAGQVLAKKYDKFRQINRFAEMVDDIVEHLPKSEKKKLKVVDFGCGKAYLTFALYHYLHEIKGFEVEMIGLDLKEEVIRQCEKLADKVGYSGLKFIIGDIKDCPIKGKVDLVISLHACDTATDIALAKAIEWDTDVILSVPCCQHELYSQVKSVELDAILRHGILKERLAALVTDAARAELLEAVGYEVKVIEFIDTEHTPKNLLIRAIRRAKSSPKALERFHRLKDALHISPCLERLIKK